MSVQCKRCYWISCKEGHQDGICKDCLNELKIQDLERQLAEAREEKVAKNLRDLNSLKHIKFLFDNKLDFDIELGVLIDMKRQELKEQG